MAKQNIRIEGMTCVHCEKTVVEALTGAGATHVVANWRDGRATLREGSRTMRR